MINFFAKSTNVSLVFQYQNFQTIGVYSTHPYPGSAPLVTRPLKMQSNEEFTSFQ